MKEYRNMKKGLIAAGLLVSLSGTAQDVSTYTPGTMGEGVVYYLPKTEIELQVTATKVVYTPGEFCQYADRYLRLTGISSQPEEHWEINSIKVNSIGIPDPDNAYAVKLKDKSAASQVELTPEGIIKAINTTSPIEKAPVTKVADTVKKRIDPRSFMTEEILIAGSTAKMAELVAKEIYNIRERQNSLTRGQADYMPKDGAALKLMLDNLDEQEQAMTAGLKENGYFLLPGGTPVSAQLHFARTVARRAERRLWTLHRQAPLNEDILRFVNRLSDLFFVMARTEMQRQDWPEEKWQEFAYKRKRL